MSEEVKIENQPETQPDNTPSKGKKFLAALKEWWRKRIVALKVKPQTIPLLVLLITSIVFMLSLFKYSVAVYRTAGETGVDGSGICIFITTLLSILVLVSFLNAFPKRKKPNIFFIVLVFVMIAAMAASDVAYYVIMGKCIKNHPATEANVSPAQPCAIAHVALLGVSAVVFALLPVYSRLIKKINTSIKIDSATEHMGEKIDIEEDND